MTELMQRVLTSALVKRQIDVHTENMLTAFRESGTSDDIRPKAVTFLEWWVEELATPILNTDPPAPNQAAPGWEMAISDWTYDFLQFDFFWEKRHDTIAHMLAERFGGEMTDYLPSGTMEKSLNLVKTFLVHMAPVAASVAYMVRLDLDPELLRVSRR